jgi:hypothetical protein
VAADALVGVAVSEGDVLPVEDDGAGLLLVLLLLVVVVVALLVVEGSLPPDPVVPAGADGVEPAALRGPAAGTSVVRAASFSVLPGPVLGSRWARLVVASSRPAA